MARAKSVRRRQEFLGDQVQEASPTRANSSRNALDKLVAGMDKVKIEKGRKKHCHLIKRALKTQADEYKIVYTDGSTYVGQALVSTNPLQRHGKGAFEAHDGDVLNGTWKDDRLHGFGTRIFTRTGDRHEGMYYKDKRHGPGTYLWANGDKYVGDFYNGRMHGSGVLISSNGDIFEGCKWEKGVIASGTKKLINGDVLHGFDQGWVDGIYTGQGRKVFRNGDEYVGTFKANTITGFGTFNRSNGDIYVGEMVLNKMHGSGHLQFCQGGDARGTFVRSALHGFVRRAYSSGAIYEGNFENGLRHGFGLYKWIDGEAYQGMWENDRPHGNGVWISEEQMYHGIWSGGVPHGHGCFINQHTKQTYFDDFIQGHNQTGTIVIHELHTES
ncbi:phosphatidylinositol-4-phosphate 5-kinase [Thraustotheca clavata]|uniref:Phosphatidylinositol-4-phosphate 5-kinase n=1 Tax=Thraustotheca clavata TaxID=74557 RepID=A0A1V9ZHC9_9STRA|nr:phosphatidylinositol-4-phosphate 5-kinase [Thraustotheca clavata]